MSRRGFRAGARQSVLQGGRSGSLRSARLGRSQDKARIEGEVFEIRRGSAETNEGAIVPCAALFGGGDEEGALVL